MDWENQLISLYLTICKLYQERAWTVCQRFTNGGYKRFTDEEAMTIYIFGVLSGLKNIKQIHTFTANHLQSFFPQMPGYAAYVHRVNVLGGAFQELLCGFQISSLTEPDTRVYLIDSFPIMLAKHNHAYTAKVAPNAASKSSNATKKIYYHGVKAHVVARKNEGKLPDVECCVVDAAGRQDGPIFDELLRPQMGNNLVFADQAYRRPDEKEVEESQDLKVITPIKKKRGQNKLAPNDKEYSKAVSRVRQPIESLFSWINRMTQIQDASLVRSTAGLITHIFGKLAAAMFSKRKTVSDF